MSRIIYLCKHAKVWIVKTMMCVYLREEFENDTVYRYFSNRGPQRLCEMEQRESKDEQKLLKASHGYRH